MANKIKINNETQNIAPTPIPTPIVNLAGAFGIVGSVGAEELSLSSIINEEADKLQRFFTIDTTPTVAEFVELTQSITRTMKTVLLKNTILESKLTETLNLIDTVGIPDNDDLLITNLIAVLSDIAAEEAALGRLIFWLGQVVERLVTLLTLDFESLQLIDQVVIALMRVITEKNLVLLSKLRRVIRFLLNNIEEFSVTPGDLQSGVAAIIELIEAINEEETGLASLIDGETAKLTEAIAITTAANVDDLLAFNNTITSVIDIVVQKNMILEAQLEDILAVLNLPALAGLLTSFFPSLTSVQQSIALEETALAGLITAEAAKINVVDFVTAADVDSLVAVNDSVTTLLESITLKNMVLGQKNLEIINFILSAL